MVAQTSRMSTEVAKLDDLRHGHLAERASALASGLVERFDFDREDLSKRLHATQHALVAGATSLGKALARRPYMYIGLGVVAASAIVLFLRRRSQPATNVSKHLRKGKKRLVQAFT